MAASFLATSCSRIPSRSETPLSKLFDDDDDDDVVMPPAAAATGSNRQHQAATGSSKQQQAATGSNRQLAGDVAAYGAAARGVQGVVVQFEEERFDAGMRHNAIDHEVADADADGSGSPPAYTPSCSDVLRAFCAWLP